MSDPRVPRARARMAPEKPVEYEIIPAIIPTNPRSYVSNNNSEPASATPSNCNLEMAQFNNTNMRNDGTLQIMPFKLEKNHFNLEERGKTDLVSNDSKSILIQILESISPDTLELLLILLKQLLISNMNSVKPPQASANSSNSPFQEAFEFILKTLGTQSLPNRPDGNVNSPGAVKMVWNQILKFNKDVFQQVEITKALQKKLNAKEIDSAIQLLLAEGGVIEQLEIEQQKGSSGRAPSPTYRLLWQNQEYTKRLISK